MTKKLRKLCELCRTMGLVVDSIIYVVLETLLVRTP